MPQPDTPRKPVPMSNPASAGPPCLGQFQPFVGTHFELESDDRGSTSLELVEAKAYGTPTHSASGDDTSTRFSLVFLCAGRRDLPQQTYVLRHPQLGKQTLFLVPVAEDSRGLHLEAVFNNDPGG